MLVRAPFWLVAVSLTLVASLWWCGLRVTSHVLPDAVLHDVDADYLEDEQTGRRLAHLDVRLVRREGQPRLQLDISAVGGRVHPIFGFRGVAGANHITARELGTLMRERQIRVFVRDGGGRRSGTVTAGRTAKLPERRLDANGALQLQAKSQIDYLVAVQGCSPALSKGHSDIYVAARGVPRLRVGVQVDGDGFGRIAEIESLSGHDIVQ